MTKEEAIFCEKSYIGETNCTDCNYYGTDTCQSRVSHKMAIKALEQEPSEDCVSRRKLEKLKKWRFSYDNNTTIPKSDIFVKLTDIRTLPPVTPERKKGKWENGNPICPCCGEDKFKDLDADLWSDWQPKYCPNCGSLMKEDEL